MGNTFGKRIRLTTFGESHGPAIGGILDGMPSLIKIDFDEVQKEMERRAPGRDARTSQRNEPDRVEFLSGFSRDGVTLGTPIGFIIRNRDARSEDYAGNIDCFRPNHADYTYYKKYGIHEFRGGGRASARETAVRVAAGALCRQWLRLSGVEVEAHFIETNNVEDARKRGDSTGGIVEGKITGLPVGLGDPVYDKFHARLSEAMMSINAAKGFEYGDGCNSSYSYGSESQDLIDIIEEGDLETLFFKSNHSGGIQGGITTGEPVYFKVYFKPTPTFLQTVETVTTSGEKKSITLGGRHDPCVAIRAVPVVEAMALLTIADFL